MENIIAIDLGGTVVKVGLLRNGEIIECIHLNSRLSIGFVSNLPRIKEAIDSILARQHIEPAQLDGIGLAFPGLVDPNKGKVISTNEKYDDACEYDLNAWIEQNWNVPFCIDNDARLAVLGEWQQGAARGKRNVVMMTIGTGIGTGVIIDGNVLYGQHYQAGSLGGHFVIDYKGRSCTCGNKGCVEAMASSFFLPVIIREHPQLSDSFKQLADKMNFKEIFGLAATGDKDALLLRNECMDIWSAAIVTYIHAYDPEIVVLGGGIMNSADVIIPYIKERVARYAWCPSSEVQIITAQLSENAALHGLCYCLNQKKKLL
ncbi:ROK family protein [uncultured Proteiniphilum sp.]|uniref:ROK family protein n=1 Tax=uncultured Proteiniphilum sp. TaxID=497637 RepID=UPI00261E20FE|nr:ROK family protein [uncultured Proteiniphilum sp.]